MRALPHVATVDPELILQDFQTGLGRVSLKHGTHSISNTVLQGSTTAMPEVQEVPIIGRPHVDGIGGEHHDNVMILGHDAAADLFPGEDPIGKDVICEGDVFTVIGVLDVLPQPFGSGRNTADNTAYFPLGTFRKIHPEFTDFWIVVKYDDPANKADRDRRGARAAARATEVARRSGR